MNPYLLVYAVGFVIALLYTIIFTMKDDVPRYYGWDGVVLGAIIFCVAWPIMLVIMAGNAIASHMSKH